MTVPSDHAGADPFLRREFPILERQTYLNSCSLGALSRRSEAYLQEFVQRWHGLGASAWYELWMGRIEDLRRHVARTHGAAPAQLALLPSTSVALSQVIESAPRRGRRRVVCTTLDFPTLVYQWHVRPDLELVLLPSPDGVRVDPEQFEAVVDERTLFVATSHVYFATGYVQDLDAVATIARNAGAYSLIDGYQGAGQIPLDLASTSVDFYTSGPLKWLLGGPGLAYLYVREPLVGALQPRLTSWFAHRRQFDFDVSTFEPRDDARRFEMGTPALPTVHTALGGQEVLEEVGMNRVLERIRALTEHLIGAARAAGLTLSVPESGRRSAIVMVRHADPAGAVRYLAERGIIVDHRPGHVRLSPHFYNEEAEVERCVEELAAYR